MQLVKIKAHVPNGKHHIIKIPMNKRIIGAMVNQILNEYPKVTKITIEIEK